ncbi:GNAT family N-acetyltransferase [Aliiroseovarius sp. KMU-50]|uniref:GNAT family N-acetyltransferase n=1 Tax=Aliiroseovarius salicola TaxID=3009082 RepID=A0ABT4W1A1_9RHOB|nr:GNAT family N-acetyltransferase [Aliiroseovarius sp. KMU-50]MDA5094290.1 GNAT family N-acetyltransferase [Aliiroseovarius sp. KMU-50]
MLKITDPKTPDQLDAVRRLCWEYHAFLRALSPFDAKIVDAVYPAEKYQQLIENLEQEHAPPTGAIRLALNGDEVVGCGMYYPFAPDTAEIKRVYVTDAARGTGAGYAIMKSLIDTARTSGYKRILMDTSKPLESAQKLYFSMGFKARGPYQDVPEIAAGHLLFFEMKL